MATNNFDPTKYGATPFNPLEQGATPISAQPQPISGGIGQTLLQTQTAPLKAGVEMGIGGLKGIGSSIVGLGQLGLKGVSKLPLSPQAQEMIRGGIQAGEELKQGILKPQTTTEKIGKTIEQVGEFMIPVGGEIRALGVLKNVPLITKALKGGLEFAGKTAIQTGGDKKQIAISAGLGVAAPIVGAGLGAVKSGITTKLPERLYSIIFKNAESDLRNYYRTIAKGEELNPTLAKEVLDRGIKGNSQNMAVYSFQKLDQLEGQVQQIVKQLGIEGKTIQLSNKKAYVNLLDDIIGTFRKGFYSARARSAAVLKNELNTTKDISVETTLKLRRFLDNMRNTSSFRTFGSALAPRQAEFKDAANLLRSKLADAGLGNLMNEERVYINALDDIIADAVKRQNRNVLGLFDLLAGGGGMAAGSPLGGVSAALAVRGFQQPFTLTNMAQALYKLRNIPSLEGLFKTIPPTINQSKK